MPSAVHTLLASLRMHRKRVLVTGATGFLGKNLVPMLLKNKYRVTVVGRSAQRTFGNEISYYTADLLKELPAGAVHAADAIIHLAGEIAIGPSLNVPRERIDHNVGMTLSVLEAARLSGKKPLVIFISTTQLYGHTKKRIATEEERPFPLEPYSASKMMCETLCVMYHALYGIPYIILRSESFYGPHQRSGMFISDTVAKMSANNHITTGSLSTRRNFSYTGDVVDAILKALNAPARAENQIYNITGTPLSMKKVVSTLAQIIGKQRGTKIRITETQNNAKPAVSVNEFATSTKKAARLLKWRARTKLKTGLQKTVDSLNQANGA